MTRMVLGWPMGRRLILAYVLFLLPILFLNIMFMVDSRGHVAAARQEIAGSSAIASVSRLQDAILRGTTPVAAAADQFGRLDLILDGAADPAIMQPTLSVLRSARTDTQTASQALIDLTVKLQDASGLTLDTDLDSYYLMDAVTGKLPGLIHDLAALAGTARGTQAAPNGAMIDATILSARIRPLLGGLQTSLDAAFRANADGTTRQRLAEPLKSAVAATTQAMQTAMAAVERDRSAAPSTVPGAAPATDAAIEQTFQQALTALGRLRDQGHAELERLLEARVQAIWMKLAMELVVPAILFLIAVAYVLTAIQRGTAKPIQAMTRAMERLANGDLAVDIPASGRGDEVGQMAAAMLIFRDNARKAEAMRDEAERVRQAKDRRQAAMDRHTHDFGSAAAGVMSGLTQAATDMRSQASSMADIVGRTRTLAHETASGAVESTRNLSAVAAATEEMSASVGEISRQVQRAAEVVRATVGQAAETDTKVSGLADTADAVGNVVRLINDIASQTNLLALNATIEAARAGDAGKGFAVVAGEVKALAAQTAKATEEIVSQIAAIRAATQDAVAAVRGVAGSITEVDQIATAIASAVEQQGVVTRDIAASVQAASVATQQATQAMETVSAMSGEVDASVRHVEEGSDRVSTTAENLRVEVSHFLTSIARTGEDDRRRYERISGEGHAVKLTARGQAAQPVPLLDMSRGGIAMRSSLVLPAGAEIELVLPGTTVAVWARVVRTENGVLGAAFRQDTNALPLIDRALDHLAAHPAQAAKPAAAGMA